MNLKRMLQNLFCVLTAFCFSLIFVSCDSNRIYELNYDLEGAYWHADSIKSFEFNIDDQAESYNLSFNLRNGLEFPHSNIYITYLLEDSMGNVLEKELRDFQLFYPKNGYPKGSGVGGLYEHEFQLLLGYQFTKAGKYRMNLRQFMRYDSLPETYSVGFRVEKMDGN